MSSCLVRGVRSVELVVTNLAEAARFYEEVWRLKPIETPPAQQAEELARFFRGSAGYHHLLGLHAGAQPAVLRIVFDVADRNGVDALHRAITAAGAKSTEPANLTSAGGGYGFGCKDPDGRNLGFVCGTGDHADTADQADVPRKIAHINLNAKDFEGSLGFFTGALGFRVIDDNAPLWFLHCDNSDHSSIVLAKTNQPTLNHVAFEMPEIEFGDARHGTHEGRRLSDRVGARPPWAGR